MTINDIDRRRRTYYNAFVMAWLDANKRAVRRDPATGEMEAAIGHVAAADPVVGRLVERHGPCTLSPSVAHFPVMVETVISQQLSTRAARAIYGRLVHEIGRGAPRPSDVLRVADSRLLAIGFSRSKAAYVKNAARAFRAGRFGPKKTIAMTDEELIGALTSIKGIGEWSAHMFLIFALHRLDVFPVGDLGLRNAMVRAYGLRTPPSRDRLRRIADAWRPYRTIGTWYLWASYDNG